MRKIPFPGRILGVFLLAVFSLSAFGSTREERGIGGWKDRVPKFVKRVVKTFGDGLVSPTPAPKP